MRRLRSAVSGPTPPPEGILGERALEARWWWVQSQTAADDAKAFLLYGWGTAYRDAFALALELAQRAVRACPSDHQDRASMATCAAQLVLDLAELAPEVIWTRLGPLLDSVREYCDLLDPKDAAPLRVQALPLTMSLGGSVAQALIELDSAHNLLAGRPMRNEVARSVQSFARFLATLGDSQRALGLFDVVEEGLARALEAQASIEPPAAVAAGLEAVRGGEIPKPIDFEAMTPNEVEASKVGLSLTSPVQTQQLVLLIDRASSLLDLGRPAEAIELFTALIDHPALQSAPTRAQALLCRAAARLDAAESEAAVVDLASATAGAPGRVDAGQLDAGLLAYVHARVAATSDARGEPDVEAATSLTEGTPLAWRAWAARAAYERSTPAVAIQSYRRMTVEIARERRSSLGYRLDSTSLRNKLPALTDAIRLASECGDWRAALELVETFKARQLQAVLADRTASIGPASTPLEEVERQIDALEYAVPGSVDPHAKAIELLKLRSERVALIERSEWQAGRIGMAGVLAPVDHLVESMTEPGLAVVDIHLDLTSRRLTAVALREGRGVVGGIDLSPHALDGIERRVANLRASSPDSLLYDPARSPALSIEQLLPPAVIEFLDGAASLVISPHGALHLISWPALQLCGQRLLVDRAVSMTPSLWVQAQLSPAPTPPHGIVCLGDPAGELMPELGYIPHAATELRIVGDLYRAAERGTTSLTGTAATVAAFIALTDRLDGQPAGQRLALHLACHATAGPDGIVGYRPFLDGPEDPLAACLILADGVVDADQVRRLRLPFAEVVLSACSTGWRPTRVDDVELVADNALGLVASFFAAGASTVVASLPPVEDAVAPEIFRRYHQNRLEGHSPSSALCATQASLLDEGHIEASQIVGFMAFGC